VKVGLAARQETAMAADVKNVANFFIFNGSKPFKQWAMHF
jgi:hypothetical protein